jgi:hypothetical protein
MLYGHLVNLCHAPAVHKIPLIHQFLELIGLAVTAVYGYRYFTDPAERWVG